MMNKFSKGFFVTLLLTAHVVDAKDQFLSSIEDANNLPQSTDEGSNNLAGDAQAEHVDEKTGRKLQIFGFGQTWGFGRNPEGSQNGNSGNTNDISNQFWGSASSGLVDYSNQAVLASLEKKSTKAPKGTQAPSVSAAPSNEDCALLGFGKGTKAPSSRRKMTKSPAVPMTKSPGKGGTSSPSLSSMPSGAPSACPSESPSTSSAPSDSSEPSAEPSGEPCSKLDFGGPGGSGKGTKSPSTRRQMTRSPSASTMSMTKSPGKGSTLAPSSSSMPSSRPSACPSESPSFSSAPSDSSAPSEGPCDLCFSSTLRSWSASQDYAEGRSCTLATPLDPEEFQFVANVLYASIELDSLWTEEENVSADSVSADNVILVDQPSGSERLGSLWRCCGGCPGVEKGTKSPGKGTKSPGGEMRKR